jgi:hypothetical protein
MKNYKYHLFNATVKVSSSIVKSANIRHIEKRIDQRINYRVWSSVNKPITNKVLTILFMKSLDI